ncbi:DUF1080 domain-containing protein [Sphingomonas sp. BK580]|uniref:3-keto-disaccharide hydrolase n=1 Tax=Sphingomonas sp. BK580 TaxID=2586972 RepID=UPI0017D0353E|nr:DUF1080 domain-containing protein [Sphingomonas sp. BK580]MBB3693987.1 hypothetical protein [Sphingomonas sp. BK580]
MRPILMGLAVAAMSAPAAAQAPATPEQLAQARMAVGDAVARPQSLVLADVPRPTGEARALLNGRDLAGWHPWLGYPDPSVTYRDQPGATPIGTTRDTAGDFAVRPIDGRPALWVKGETWGALVHDADLRDYHLRLQYRWGAKRWAPRLGQPPNNGLLYHTHGAPGAVFGTWQPSVEFEIMQGSTGMAVAVGRDVRLRTTAALDPTLVSPPVRYRQGGRPVEIVNGTLIWNVENARDAEKPAGQWNTLDLYVLGDRAVHVVNGVPVMVVEGLATVDAAGKRTPLTHGSVQLQSEGAETWFRDITVEPIDRLPRVVAKE